MLAIARPRQAVTRPPVWNAAVAFLIVFLVAGCAEPASRGLPLPTIPTTAEVRSVCLSVEQKYQEVDGQVADQPITKTVTEILQRLGLKVVAGWEADCDATLGITVVLRPLGERYGPDPMTANRTCYSGAEAVGQATLVVRGRDPLARPFEGKVEPPPVVTKCRKAVDAPFGALWQKPLLSQLGEWWGLPALVAAMGIEDPSAGGERPSLAGAAAAVIAGMGSAAAPVVPFFMDQLRSGDTGTFATAAHAIVRISPEAAVEAMPLLMTPMQEGDRETRLSVIRALGETATPVPGEVVDALVIALAGDEDPYLRAEAARMLAGMGADATAAVPALISAIGDTGPVMGGEAATVGEAAVAALGGIGGSAAVSALVDALAKGGGLKSGAIDALKELGSAAVPAVPALIDLLGDADWLHAARIQLALRAITGQDLGDDAHAWERWWRTRECANGTASTKAIVARPDGEITAVVEQAGFVPATFVDPRPCGPFSPPGCNAAQPPSVEALGRFFVVRYALTNATAAAVDRPAMCSTASPRRQCAGQAWWLTDGQVSWPAVGYHDWAPWVASQGADPDPSLDPGQSVTDWAVFDVPEGFEPKAICWPASDATQACLTWP